MESVLNENAKEATSGLGYRSTSSLIRLAAGPGTASTTAMFYTFSSQHVPAGPVIPVLNYDGMVTSAARYLVDLDTNGLHSSCVLLPGVPIYSGNHGGMLGRSGIRCYSGLRAGLRTKFVETKSLHEDLSEFQGHGDVKEKVDCRVREGDLHSNLPLPSAFHVFH